MDTLYLLRFNNRTSKNELLEEADNLRREEELLQKRLIENFESLRYSEAFRLNAQLAEKHQRQAYIARLLERNFSYTASPGK